MSPTKKYKNSPIIEVICEFQFENLDITIEEIDASFGNSIKGEYIERVEKKSIILDINTNEPFIEKSIGKNKSSIYQYKNSEQNSLVQFNSNLLAINQLQPYLSWEDFCPTVIKMFNAFKQKTGIESISQIKLRYINRINIKEENGSIGDYFKYCLQVPNEISNNLASIRLNSEHLFHNRRDVLTLSLHNTPSQDNSVAFIFDLNYVLIDKTQFKEKNIVSWLNDAHQTINSTFEDSLTEKCKFLFE